MNLSLKVPIYFLGHEGVWMIPYSHLMSKQGLAGAYPQ